MKYIHQSLQVILPTGTIILVLIASPAIAMLNTTSIIAGISVSVFVICSSIVLLYISREEQKERERDLFSKLDEIRGNQNITHTKLDRASEALNLKPLVASLSGTLELTMLDAAYVLRQGYESHKDRKWLYISGIRKSLALIPTKESLSPAEKEMLLDWMKSTLSNKPLSNTK